ncbi:hypothetical protein CONLIGDRAFT_641600 [Coniochaeta ligniaria NRRL 30616]|uniref:Uncharacterized protein n=1 Tax=Coniochaeta ligniaria NRRL 30616 TaxID=1408157 RepID=A0A1J7JR27_9PEZI|nr:hypothetical protein CONLIGDRAFT_641600 [Coniochaeta ligniaria NRRL 30616]
MTGPYNTFGLSCPSGGSFYICQNNQTEFIGCCTIDPCHDGSGSCPQENLRNASFSADSYEGLKPQECAEETGLWYTCKGDKPPFLGCCASNPCASMACPEGDLVPAKLSTDPGRRDIFVTAAVNSTASRNSTGTGIPSGTSILLVGDTGTRLSTGIIVGISLSVVIVVLVVIWGCVFMFKRGWHAGRRKERGSATPFLRSPPSGRFTSPILSPPFTPYRGKRRSDSDSQAYNSPGNTLGLATPPLFCAQSPPQSTYPFSPYNGSTAGDSPMPLFPGHVRSSSYISELGTQPPRIQELETEHNSQEFARHELAAESSTRTPRSRVPNQSEELPMTPPRTSISREAGRREDPTRTPESRPRTRGSIINKELPKIPPRTPPKTPPRTPPPVVVSPETSPTLVSRFSASRRNAVKGLNILDTPAALFAGSPRRRESAALLSPETPGRRSGSSVHNDYHRAQR